MIIQIVEITKDVNIIQRVHDTNVPVFRDTVKLIHSVWFRIARQILLFVILMHNARRHMTVVLNVFASMDIVEMEFFIVSRIISTAMSLIIAEEMPFADTIKQLLITPAFVYRYEYYFFQLCSSLKIPCNLWKNSYFFSSPLFETICKPEILLLVY